MSRSRHRPPLLRLPSRAASDDGGTRLLRPPQHPPLVLWLGPRPTRRQLRMVQRPRVVAALGMPRWTTKLGRGGEHGHPQPT